MYYFSFRDFSREILHEYLKRVFTLLFELPFFSVTVNRALPNLLNTLSGENEKNQITSINRINIAADNDDGGAFSFCYNSSSIYPFRLIVTNPNHASVKNHI